MENLVVNNKILEESFRNKIILVTGHTGFIGSWLTLWLLKLGSTVIGYSLKPNTKPNVFEVLDIKNQIIHVVGDIRNKAKLETKINEFKPEFVFHLAAQPLVIESYKKPLYTFETNVIGTANVLDAIKNTSSVKVGIMMTSDKSYENLGKLHRFKEEDPMGGHDPYSASKGASELIISSYRRSFFDSKKNVAISSIRAGNVIGGGDWADDRIVPDCIRSIVSNKPIFLRYPKSTRPFQFVLEPISGILCLAKKMTTDSTAFSQAWNFGPKNRSLELTVEELIRLILEYWGQKNHPIQYDPLYKNYYESKLLRLNSSKAMNLLEWRPTYTIKEAIKNTVLWYKEFLSNHDMKEFTLTQIDKYMKTMNMKTMNMKTMNMKTS